jgi:hypothetical protein
MLYRETISLILHDVQANRKGILTLEKPTPLDPRLVSLFLISQASLIPLKTLYNRF